MIQIGTLSVDFEQRDIRRQGASLRIGARALDILEVLHRASGSVVSKDDIMDAVWPGLIVEENRLQVHVATLRKALGTSRDLIKTVPGRGYLLVACASPGPERPPAADAPAAVPADAHASSPPAPLVGRDTEIAQIVEMLERTPVVTLVGAGGIGKTSLAVRVAHAVRSRSRERVLFVELARAGTRADMLIALAAELGLDTQRVPAIEDIGAAFAASRYLLVLDNAEHIVDLVASLVETLTSCAGSLRVLVTSREPLHISAEAVLRMSPLAVPGDDARPDEIVRCSAVELFLERVRTAAPDCPVDEAGMRLIADICRRLDGLPLAIELAAARVATLGLAVVASRLDDRLNLLTGGLRSALPRHQTLRATFDWSYVLLDAGARALFRRMGCFIGPFTFDAAHAVATEPGTSAADMIAVLGELVAKSLVTVEFHGAYARYRLTESTRAYALEKLHNEGEFERIAARHARYEHEQGHEREHGHEHAAANVDAARRDDVVAEAPNDGSTDVVAEAPNDASADVVAEAPNDESADVVAEAPNDAPADGVAVVLNDAPADAVTQAPNDAPADASTDALALAADETPVPEADLLARALLEPARMHECAARARQVLDAFDTAAADPVDAAREMRLRAACASALLHTDGDAMAAAAMWDRTLGLAAHVGDATFDARALVGLWNTMLTLSDIHESLRYATRFERAAERRGDRSQRLLANAMVATSLHYFGEHAQARERLEAATAELGEVGEPPCAQAALGVDMTTLARTMLTRLVWMQGDPDHAMRIAAQAVECARRGPSALALCVVLGAAAVPIALRYGDHDITSDYLATLRTTASAHGFDIWRNHAECLTGQFDIQAGHPGAGLARLEPALRRVEASGFRRLLAPLNVAYAEGLVRVGRAGEARTRLDATLARCRAHGEHLFVPELLRVTGVAMLEQARIAAPDVALAYEADGHRHLQMAIQTANGQGASMWALRGALDLADHLIERGRTAHASTLVAGVARHFDPHSRAHDVRRLLRVQNFVRQDMPPPSRTPARHDAADAAQQAA
ncbi:MULTISPECIES: ATP-binding protein [Burkholderia]|jgi:predicted ATPase/DNA-binding winged helix-turn-helix (wHTH) protein|uniref:Winged helix-turn-helix domain-containing protein n=4 Tax=Burkholderia TaxID=32008 RepID=A0A250LJ55_9BURK|nr:MULTISPECIES: winged helix-turn-helix domain-containing protein [Burkholderia]KKL42469.1 transcriptional regulator [Burkholderia contaminans LMG 23361]MBA9831818.1 transcriptional regulator [Burkholderia contaminans]MBA9841189.1 transcriptional regulator [Burkholderia contaminans]MBA9864982.1 transcriptional regulator [Burkholderia contaminans]MBA9907983.1 transcriptional regulator [Burkholderia contaminans]